MNNYNWTLFTYSSGANPYIAFTQAEARRVIRRWRKRGAVVRQLRPRFWCIDDKEEWEG